MAEEVLNAVRESRDQFQIDVARFETHISYLIRLASPDTEVEEPDKTTLARLFGRYGTDVTTRVEVEVPPEDPEFNKQALQKVEELDAHWAHQRLMHTGEESMIDHAIDLLGEIYGALEHSGGSQHDN